MVVAIRTEQTASTGNRRLEVARETGSAIRGTSTAAQTVAVRVTRKAETILPKEANRTGEGAGSVEERIWRETGGAVRSRGLTLTAVRGLRALLT